MEGKRRYSDNAHAVKVAAILTGGGKTLLYGKQPFKLN